MDIPETSYAIAPDGTHASFTVPAGMVLVITDLVAAQYKDRPEEFEKAKQIFNLLGDRVENVTPHLVDQILANDKNGAALRHMSTPRMMTRMITGKLRNRDLFDQA